LLDEARRIADDGIGEFRATLRRQPSSPAPGGKGDQVLGSLSVTHSEGCSWGAGRSERDRMTQRKHLKRLVRSRAAATGQSYAAALRSIRQHRPEDRMPATTETADNPITSCSFCDKPSAAVEKLVAGPAVYICNECVDLSATIIADAAHSTPEESERRQAQFASPSAEDILHLLPGAARLAARVEADLSRKVGRLRELGTAWPQIADALGMSTDAARQRFDR
jgi:hypothetical protein